MQMIKLFILFVIFLLSNFIGRVIAGKYRYRLEELKELKSALEIFKTKIKFTYETIPEIFDEIAKISSKNIQNIFINARQLMNIKSAGEAWKQSIQETNCNINSEDKDTLTILSKMLGKSDVDGQVSQIDVTLQFLEKQIQEAEDDKNKNEKLYKKLGAIMGLAIVIILI